MLVERFTSLFSNTTNLQVNVKEKISFFTLEIESPELPSIDEGILTGILSLIPQRDNYQLTLGLKDAEALTLNRGDDLQTWFGHYWNAVQDFENGEVFIAHLNIDKSSVNPIRAIYSYEHFLSFWNEIKPLELLDVLKQTIEPHGYIEFKTLDPDILPFATKTIALNKEIFVDEEEDKKIKAFKENCYFESTKSYPLTPNSFHLYDRSNEDMSGHLDILASLFSIVYLFDITSLKDSRLEYKLNGYRTLKGEVAIDDKLVTCKDVYYNIFSWCYSTEGNVTDKLGLIRNLLPIHIHGDDIRELNDRVLVSINSSYQMYLKGNLSKYIEIRGKILDELNWISQKSSDIIEKYLNNYQRSVLTVLSFFISVFVLRILNDAEFNSVFTKDATILTFAFLLLSVIYLIFSTATLQAEKKRLKRKYQNTKDRFKDLLDSQDIENILSGDSEFQYEIKFIEDRRDRYLWLWIISLGVLAAAVISASDYFSWSTICNFFRCGH